MEKGFRGRYWDRTSDLCRVKVFQGVSLTGENGPNRLDSLGIPVPIGFRHLASFRGKSRPMRVLHVELVCTTLQYDPANADCEPAVRRLPAGLPPGRVPRVPIACAVWGDALDPVRPVDDVSALTEDEWVDEGVVGKDGLGFLQ